MPQAGEGTLRTSAVCRSFAGVQALTEVTLSVSVGEIVGLIGPNGAGKSTLVNVITGFDTPTSGTVTLDDTEIAGWSARRLARSGLARTFQHGHSFPTMSAGENVEVAALGVGATPAEARRRRTDVLARVGLSERTGAAAGSLSHGDVRLLGVARALATRPRFLLLDEPAAGLNDAEADTFAEVLNTIRDDGTTGVLLIDHNVPLVLSTCDRIHVLDQGRTIAEGTPHEIRSNAAVIDAYLGETA
jgi:branched-chain amino acid transport system ATP-binding protein